MQTDAVSEEPSCRRCVDEIARRSVRKKDNSFADQKMIERVPPKHTAHRRTAFLRHVRLNREGDGDAAGAGDVFSAIGLCIGEEHRRLAARGRKCRVGLSSGLMNARLAIFERAGDVAKRAHRRIGRMQVEKIDRQRLQG